MSDLYNRIMELCAAKMKMLMKRGRFSALPSFFAHMLFMASRRARFTRSSPVSFIMR